MRRSEPQENTAPKRRGRLALALAFGASLLAVASGARADEPTRNSVSEQLTSRGRAMVSGALGGSWSSDRSGSLGVLKRWQVYASPSLTYFIRDRLGLGLTLGGGTSETAYGGRGTYITNYRESELFVTVNGAFDLPLSARFSLLFQPALGYANLWQKNNGAPLVSGAPLRPLHMQTLRAALATQLLLRLSPYVALGMGPDVWTDIILDDGGLRAGLKQSTAFGPGMPKQRYVRVQVGISVSLLLSF